MILLVLAGIWEAYGRYLDNAVFPTFSATVAAFVRGLGGRHAAGPRLVVAEGPADGLRRRRRPGERADGARHRVADRDRPVETLTSMFNPLPAIALLPLALIWFGLATAA